MAEQAAVAAELSVEEVLEARDAESDRGIPAPSRCELSAEEQTELLRRMIEKQKQKELQQSAKRSSGSSERISLRAKRRKCWRWSLRQDVVHNGSWELDVEKGHETAA